MSSLHISILCTLLTIIFADNNKTFYFTKSNYDLWCQENILSNSLFLYSNRIPIGIYRTSNIKSVTYQLIDDNNNGLFEIKSKRLADFYFLIINITRPFDINREYQDVYKLRIQANIVTTQENQSEQTEVRLHVADSNDNDGVFDMDIYEQNFTQPIEIAQPLLRLHASDADEIQHAQIFYELASSLNETFSLHPFTGDLYITTKENLKSTYEFDVYAYDRYQKRLVDNNMKTKTHVKLHFNQTKFQLEKFQTLSNQTIEYRELISSYDIHIYERKTFHLLNIHQPILTIDIKPNEKSYEIFFLFNSSLNTQNLFLNQNNIYLNKYLIEEYNLQLMICFNNYNQCQYTNYRLIPLIDFNFYNFHFKSIENIYLDDNLPVDSFITHIQLDYKNLYQEQSLIINYKLLNDEKDFRFYLDSKTGILRLAERLEYRNYSLDIQANIQLFNRKYSIETTVNINVREINKHRPVFRNNTPNELVQLPYQFQAFDLDQNKQTNGRITYRLWNCETSCPFSIDPNNGTLILVNKEDFIKDKIYNTQIIAFDWGQPISLESSIDIRVNLSPRFNRRDLGRTRAYSRRWRKKITANLLTTTMNTMVTEKSSYTTNLPLNIDTINLNIGFRENFTSYYLSEDAEINHIIDYLKIEYDSFPININNDQDNLFFYTINDTNLPFTIDQNTKSLKLIDKIDREKQDKYIFEIELKLKSIYSIKLQEQYSCQKTNISMINFQYTKNYYQKILIIIHINDINDNIPICSNFHTNIQLNENELRKNIFQIQAYDPDLGENGTISYSLFDYNQYFFINSSTGQIDCIKSIDYEEYSFIELHIIASDHGIQPKFQSICTTLHIQINDINDNTPQFFSMNYIFNVFFDMPRYSIFGQIYAFDSDRDNQLIYSLSPNPYIIINKHTGYLRLKHNLHRLIDQILNVTVEVTDGLYKNTTTVHIYVKSFPDAQQPILLAEPGYGLTINESLNVGSVVTNIYRRLQITASTIDFIEIIHDEMNLPFSIDQLGYLRLTHSLIGLSKSSYWLAIRLTRYRAHPPHTFVHIHLSIRQENFYLPQCVNIYQNVKVYDYSTQHPFARVEAISLNKNSLLQYSINDNDQYEKIFSIDQRTGFLNLLPSVSNNRRLKSDYLLTIKTFDIQYKFSVNCYVNIHLIRRRQLIPKFIYSPSYNINSYEIERNSGRLRQRLFQIIALLDNKVYDKKLEIRYRIADTNQHFIINRQTGYVAAKQPLKAYTTYEFNVEAFTVAHRDDILSDGNENEDDEQHTNRGKWRIVSSRVSLPIKIQILPMISANHSLSPTIDSTINTDLLTTTEVGSTILQLGINNRLNNTQWFVMIGHIRNTRYFHVDFQTGQLILIRPIVELLNQTNIIELHINVTNDWINMNTIKVIIRIINNQIPSIEFPQNDYYTSISKNIPLGAEIARLTIDNSVNDCTYSIDTVEKIKSKDLFRIDSFSGSVTVINSLENSSSQTHLLTIIYRCQHNYHIAHTNLHIQILDEKNLLNKTTNSYRFSQENYLIIFETSLIKNRRKYLMNFELISNDDEEKRRIPNAKILQGDPLGLFSIDPSNQSLIFLDESLARSYTYPLNLTIIDVSQMDTITSIVTIFISNIGIYFPCPSYVKTSPYLFTYESLPLKSIDPLTGQQYKSYNSLIVRAFDPFTPINGEASNLAECIIDNDNNISQNLSIKNLDFIFENENYFGYINDSFGSSSFIYTDQQTPLHIQLKTSFNLLDTTYHLLNETHRNYFQLDEYAGLIKYNSLENLQNKYSFLIYAKYQSLVTFTRINLFINHKIILKQPAYQSIYEFKLYTPFVNNSTIGYINISNKNLTILNENILPMISIDGLGRLFIKNRTLILTSGNFYDFLIQDEDLKIIRIQILVINDLNQISECILNRLDYSIDQQFIGFINIINRNQTNTNCYQSINQSFYLLNYNELFLLDRQHGLLYYRNPNQTINEDVILLIQTDNSKCLITVEKSISNVSYIMIRNGSQLQIELNEKYNIQKSSGQLKLINGTLFNYDIIPSQSPIFSQKSYDFSLNLTNPINHSIFIGQISAEPYDKNRSHVVYQFLNRNKYYLINPDNGIIEYISNEYYNKTLEQFQILARDLIYGQNTTINITIHIRKSDEISFSSLIYEKNISEILPPGSLIIQSNSSTLRDYNSNLFEKNPTTGEIILMNYLSDKFYSFKLQTLKQISIIKLIVNDYNSHYPQFQNPPINLSLSSSQTFITKLSANDLDLNDNLNLKYYLLDKDQEKYFSINSTNGIITMNNSSLNKNFYQLNIGVSDGLYLTKTYFQIQLNNYSKNSPKFSSNEYIFQYDQTKDVFGQIIAYDLDINDQIFYDLYLQPHGVEINKSSGLIKIPKTLFLKPIIEFYASATDLSNQIVYKKIKLIYSIQPKFNSNLYFISLLTSNMIIPLEIFQFDIVDLFNQSLKSAKYQLKNQTNLFEMNDNKLILKEYLLPTDKYYLNVNAYWKNFIIQTSIQINFVEKFIHLEKKSYEFQLEKNLLKKDFFIEKFSIKNNFRLKISSTPLTRNDCHENFYIKSNELIFSNFPILSDICFFELHLTDNISISTSQVKILFMDSNIQPKFSSKIYYFYIKNNDDYTKNIFRVFANSSNSIRYKLDNNSYGLFINSNDGILKFQYNLDFMKNIDRIYLNVYAIDEKNNVNDTALIDISFNESKQFELPKNYSQIELCPNIPILLSDQSLPGTVIQDISLNINNISNNYYILSGDTYGLFAINNLGQLYLTSPILNQTSEEYFELTILISSLSSSLSYCRTNISIIRTPKWSHFICPAIPIQWMINEESPIGTIIGTVKETLLTINNSSELINHLQFKLNISYNDAQFFLLNSRTGVITSNARLDYEQKPYYSFSVILEPTELNCSILIYIKLINMNDNPIVFNNKSLIYNVTENNLVPFYVGRIDLIDIDQLFISEYEYYLKNASSQISIDPLTGSIILYEKLDREYHGSFIQYEILAIDTHNQGNNLTNQLILYINDLNDNGPMFDKDTYYLNISKTTRPNTNIFQVNATSKDPIMNGNLTYYLLNSTDYFSIDKYTGIIRLKQSLSSMITNFTLNIQVFEDGVNLTDQMNLFISIINDDNVYFDLENQKKCFINENENIGTRICTIGRNSNDFIYELIDKMNFFQLIENNGTIINKKIFDYENDLHQYNVTIIVRDRENQSIPLSSLNLTIYIGNVNDNHPEILTKNFTTLVYFYQPSVDTVLHRIDIIDKDYSNLTFEIFNNTFSSYKIQLNGNTTELILLEPILVDHEDNLIIRVWDNDTLLSPYYIDLYLRLIYLQRQIELPTILPQTIDGYINLEEQSSRVNFGEIFLQNHSEYKFILYNLISNKNFFLKQISNNQTELYFNSLQQYSQQQKHQRLLQYQIELTAIAINQSIPNINFSNNTIIYLPTNINSSVKSHSIDVHLWLIDREMLDRTLSILINLNPKSTYEQFIMNSLPLIREHLAAIIGVHIRHVHIYSFNFKNPNQIELLIAIIRYPSRLRPPRYIHKKLVYNVLKNSSNLFEKIPNIKSIEKISINQCQVNSCENNGRCTSHIKLYSNQYDYFYYNTYQRLIPKYQWNIKCLCLNHYYGQHCQFKQDYQSPCSSNPCSSLERCIEESSTLYTCQCIDEPCNYNEIISESTLDCININSPTCRDSSNTLTFDGYSFVRMSSILNLTQHTNLTFTFRTQVSQGVLLKLISFDEKKLQHNILIQIKDSHINLELDKKMLFQINEITINDGLWHTIFFSIDYTSTNQNYYYLLRLDNVFGNKIQLFQSMLSNQLKEFIIGNDFHGCLGNLTLNNQIIYLQKQDKNPLLEHIGTNNGCQLAEIETRTLRQYTGKDDLCSLYHPCYNGGICSSQTTKHGLSFICNCLKPRFSGRQCQRDLHPCESHPCLFNEQCISSNHLNISYTCISSLANLPMSTKNLLYIGLAVTFCTFILFMLLFLSLIIYCQQKRKEKKKKIVLNHDKPTVSAPLLIQKSSPTLTPANTIESPMQTLLKINTNGKQTVETMALVDNNLTESGMNNFNDKLTNNHVEKISQSIDKIPYQSHESLNRRRSDPKYYSTIGKMNIPPDNFLSHYNSIDYDSTRIPLVDPHSSDLFDFPSSPTKYFNSHNGDNATNYQICINSLSNLTEKLVEQNDIELTHSSNDSSNNEQTLLTSPISNGKRSLFNGGSAHSIRASTSSLQKAPVYAKVVKATSKSSNGGMSTIERLRLSGSPLRLLSSSPTYARTTSFLKSNTTNDNEHSHTSSSNKISKINPTSWKLNPRKLDSLKARRNSRYTDDDEDDNNNNNNNNNNNETSQLTMKTTITNRLRHASDSDLTKERGNGKKGTKLSSFFQTEV
ncbi:unnamed protein product [Adineta steineri]|uniref:Uncharacterized protein n=1 Tax=Adineta steineri TaxID=433720 RepID=A0A818MUY9_9BILA|nr:unnamed protein product [Adineta steineri]